MPRVAVSADRVLKMRHRFRLIVDKAFGGHLSMTADALKMPFSTVQQYYHRGPRRYNPSVVEHMRWYLDVNAAWILGDMPMNPEDERKLASRLRCIGEPMRRRWIEQTVSALQAKMEEQWTSGSN